MKAFAFLAVFAFVCYLGSTQELVKVDVENSGNLPEAKGPRRVRVNVPFFVDLDVFRQRNKGINSQTDLDLGVLGGLVQVNLNRRRDPETGRRVGPIGVSVFGQKLYGDRR